VAAARGADVVVAEATLTSAEFDDPRRGHLTPEEALDMADRAGAGKVVLVHFRAELRPRIDGACAKRPGAVAGYPGLRIEVEAAEARADPAAEPRPVRLIS
jgi:ribonuclease BN (tRNA processing enzyme)